MEQADNQPIPGPEATEEAGSASPKIAGGSDGNDAASFVSVSAREAHTCGVRSDGSAACWGSNEDSWGNMVDQAMPPDGSLVSVSAGGGNTCGVRSDGSVACWGKDDAGQATPPEGSFTSVSAGGLHLRGEERRLRRLLGLRWRRPGHAAQGFLRLRQRRVDAHLRGEERRLHRLLGLRWRGPGHAARGFLHLRQHQGGPHLRGEERRLRRLLGRSSAWRDRLGLPAIARRIILGPGRRRGGGEFPFTMPARPAERTPSRRYTWLLCWTRTTGRGLGRVTARTGSPKFL